MSFVWIEFVMVFFCGTIDLLHLVFLDSLQLNRSYNASIFNGYN